FGSRAMSVLAEYWTVADRNTRTVPLEGVLLWNRALWVGFAALLAGLCYWRFSFSAFASEGVGKRASSSVRAEPVLRQAQDRSEYKPVRAEPVEAGALAGQALRQAQGERGLETSGAPPSALFLLPHL